MNKKRRVLSKLLWLSVFAVGIVLTSWFSTKDADAACSHTYRWVTMKQPTCAATGYRNYTCSKCGHTKSSAMLEKVPNHTWNINAATCTVSKRCTTCKTVAQSATGHSYSWVTMKQPTCAATGYRNYTCSKCGNTTNSATLEKVPNHTWNINAATCTVTKKCTTCGVVGQNALGHYFTGMTCSKDGKCTRCPATGGSRPAHIYAAATCTSPRKCSCGATTGSALGHSYAWVTILEPTSTSTGYRNYQCTRSGCRSVLNSATIDKVPPTVVDINKVLFGEDYQLQASRVERSGETYINKGGICNMCALVNLLNRNLAADGLYSESNKFDIEYVTRVSCLKLVGNKLTVESAKSMECVYKTNVTSKEGKLVATRAVICNFDTDGYLNKPIFSIGNKNYIAVEDKLSSDPKQQIIDLLAKHPEGIFVRALYNGGGHCFVITGYENGTFKVIDTARSDMFEIDQPLNECWYSKQNGADFFNKIQRILHLEETNTKSEIVMSGN